MTLPMHSPESRQKILRRKVERMERMMSRAQREGYVRWWTACRKQGIAVTLETRFEFLQDQREDVER